jgi:YidC/Oxa1 family membrane protein insertase
VVLNPLTTITACRTLLLPLSIQQTKIAEYMKVLKPHVKKIKAKYKGNEEAANQAVGRLYQDTKQNPLAGCAVSLATLPVFLGRRVRFGILP